MAIVFGLTAALLWGLGDFLSRFSARGLGPWRATFYGQLPGLLIFSTWLAASSAARAPAFHAPPWIWALAVLAALCTVAAGYALTRGLIIGAVSLVIPLVASYGAVAAVLAVLTGERLALVAAVGIIATVAGVVFAAMGRGRTTTAAHRGAGASWALAAAAGYGVTIWLQGRFIIPRMGPEMPLWISAIGNMTVALAFAGVRRQSLALPPRRLILFTFGYGTFTATAYLSMALGLMTGKVAIVGVLSSLSGTVTAVLGFALLAERLAMRQRGGIALILVGVALINLG
jgi:probable blue pigment (indigoidine) exporter